MTDSCLPESSDLPFLAQKYRISQLRVRVRHQKQTKSLEFTENKDLRTSPCHHHTSPRVPSGSLALLYRQPGAGPRRSPITYIAVTGRQDHKPSTLEFSTKADGALPSLAPALNNSSYALSQDRLTHLDLIYGQNSCTTAQL